MLVLVLAGGGVWRGSVTRELAEEASRADVVYVEYYTVPGAEWLAEEMERLAPGRVVVAGRGLLEQGSREVVERAARGRVLVVAPGDPLVATTHVSLLVEAARAGVEWRVVPGVSGVVAAKVASGLQYYKYGRTFTVPGPWRGVRAHSIVYYLYANLCAGLHSLVLLDVSEEGEPLEPADGARELAALEEEVARGEGLEPLSPRLLALAVYEAGTPRVRVAHSTLAGLAGAAPRGWPASIVVPGLIHPSEAEALEALHSVDPGLVEAHNEAVRRVRGALCQLASRA